jgi:hypothetical protein
MQNDDPKPTESADLTVADPFEGMTDEEMDAALAGVEPNEQDELAGEMEIGEADPESAAEGDPADDEAEETDESEEAPEEGPGDQEKVDAEDSEDDEEGEDDPEDDSAVDLRKVLSRLEVLELERESLAAQLERERMLRDRNAGKLGSLMQQLEKTRDGSAADGDSEFHEPADPDEDRPTSKNSELDSALSEIRQEKSQRAITGAVQDFYTENIEFFDSLEASAGPEAVQEFQTTLLGRLQEQQKEFGEDLANMSPKMAGKMAGTLMKSAYMDLRAELMRDLQKKASAQSEQSRRTVRARKKGAAGVRSKAARKAQTTKPKSLSQMSDDELDAQLRAVSSQLE